MGTFRPGEVVGGRYEIIERLGSGGMADVYRAHDPHLGRDVAVKVLADRYAADPAFVERFRREASAAARLNHPNIVQVFDRGEAEGTYYIVMEYLIGPDLKTVIRDRGPLPPLEAIDNTQQILAALAAAHRRDVIHRDIKPQNVMLASDGLLKVTDFGIARAGAESDMTEAGSVIGTAQYLSPEQAHGGELTSASDCYSAGIVLYEMLTGRVPFDGDRPVVVAMKQINEPPVPPRTYVSGIPADLEAVVLKSIAKRPSERFRSAEEFSAALSEVRRQIDPEGTAQHTIVMPAAIAETADATTVIPATAAQPTAVAPAAAAPARKRSRGTRIVIGIIVALGILAVAGLLYATHRGGSSNSATVPTNLIGQPVASAKAELINDGFKVATTTAASSSANKGLVIASSPAGGQSVPKGSMVTLTAGGGQPTAAVPNVVHLTQAQATSQLQAAGFAVIVVSAPSASVPVGSVISQSPAPSTQLAPKQSVTITVSSGPAVPDVTGKTLSEATQLLQAEGLSVGTVTDQASTSVAAGLVISQSVPTGSSAQAGQSVNLVVSTGTPSAVVPGVIGQTSADAAAAIRAAGFVANQATAYSAASPGTVISQTPAGDTSAARGSTVTITVSLGPQSSTTTSTGTTPAPPPTTGERPGANAGRA